MFAHLKKVSNEEIETNDMINSEDTDLEKSVLLPPKKKEIQLSINQKPKPGSCYLSPLRYLVYLMQTAPASTEAADIAMSLYQSHSKSPLVLISAPTFAFLTSIGLTGKPIKENCDEVCLLITKKKLSNDPTEWPKISPIKEKIAFGITLFITPFNSGGDGLQSFFFMRNVSNDYFPNASIYILQTWNILSGIVALGVSGSKILTESTEAYKTLRRIFANERKPYVNKFSRFVTPIVGGLFGIAKTGQEAVQTYISVKWVFSVKGTVNMCIIGGLSLVNMFPNFSFSGIYNATCLDAFFGRIWNGDFGPKEIIAFIFAASGATYVAFWKRSLNLLFYQDVRSDMDYFKDYLTDSTLIGASWVMFAEDIYEGTAALYSPMYDVVKYVWKKASDLGQTISHLFFPEKKSSNEEQDSLFDAGNENNDDKDSEKFFEINDDEESTRDIINEITEPEEISIEEQNDHLDENGPNDIESALANSTLSEKNIRTEIDEASVIESGKDERCKPYRENNSNLIFSNTKNLQKKQNENPKKASFCLMM